jgi:hypothetical protein
MAKSNDDAQEYMPQDLFVTTQVLGDLDCKLQVIAVFWPFPDLLS